MLIQGAAFLSSVLCLTGLLALRFAWANPRHSRRRIYMTAGWAAFIAGSIAFSYGAGAELGIPFTLVLISLLALGLIATGVKRRPEKAGRPRAAVDPSDRASKWWRGVIRTLLAGPLSGLAAIAIGIAVAVKLPLPEADRLIIGGCLVPVLWGCGMAWTLADDRILRALTVLTGASIGGFMIGML